MKRNIIMLYLQYLLSWQVMVYIHHRKKRQCLTWLWRMWKHWHVEKKILCVLMDVIIMVMDVTVILGFQLIAKQTKK